MARQLLYRCTAALPVCLGEVATSGSGHTWAHGEALCKAGRGMWATRGFASAFDPFVRPSQQESPEQEGGSPDAGASVQPNRGLRPGHMGGSTQLQHQERHVHVNGVGGGGGQNHQDAAALLPGSRSHAAILLPARRATAASGPSTGQDGAATSGSSSRTVDGTPPPAEAPRPQASQPGNRPGGNSGPQPPGSRPPPQGERWRRNEGGPGNLQWGGRRFEERGHPRPPPSEMDLDLDDLDSENGGPKGRRRQFGGGKTERDRERDRLKQKDRTPSRPLSQRQKSKLSTFRKDKDQKAGSKSRRQRDLEEDSKDEGPEMPRQVSIPHQCSVKGLAALMEISTSRLEEILIDLGEPPRSLEDIVEFDTSELACLESNIIATREIGTEEHEDSEPRPAVVAVMGHVDHGKTSLLDALRNTSVVDKEAGGITQHIGAFEVALPESGTGLTFLDTPGHAAFSAMRARGAAVTDIVVLVVAADDSVMPQTLEAISHARAAGCPIVVALSKIDMETADQERVKRDLAANGLELEEYGGDVQVVPVAAPKGIGLQALEEALLLQADILSVKASRTAQPAGVVVEARLDKGQGPVSTVIITRGALRVGDPIVVGCQWGRVRALRSPSGEPLEEVTPGKPAVVSGLKGVPEAGDELMRVGSEERARRMSTARTERAHDYRLARLSKTIAASRLLAEADIRAKMLVAQKAARRERRGRRIKQLSAAPGTEHKVEMEEEEGAEQRAVVLPVLVKADVFGSIEAVQSAIEALSSSKAMVQVVHTGVGPVSLSDVSLATVTGAKILAFNVRPDSGAVQKEAKAAGVDIMQYRVIYHLLEEIGGLLAGAAPRVQVETVTGLAQVLQIFEVTGKRRSGAATTSIAGCKVTQGTIHWRRAKAYRVLRGGEVVHEGMVSSLRREKTETQEIAEGSECGLVLQEFNDFAIGDVLQCVCVEEHAPKTQAVVGGGVRVVDGEHH
eukprot:CAMPEP_0117663760 /NCGR_PEP_ID=MMETSP0804-20121206/8797_1 /TAXON_ID=1074897 /ORGANISM="Tetraselmis astigmatica, Strain CCMP880" /LENGTH=962 /DNA_ID=CAMNT_0005470825 /DNA_START=460 /DNA_END=3349 /DNA_ORIENTATION=+